MRGATLIAAALALAPPIAAQQDTLQRQDSLLIEAMQLATEGRGDSARALVRGRLREVSPTDSLYPGILYAAGVVAGDIDSARTYFRRVSFEYPRSEWADDALVRLAQLAFAAGEYARAQQATERVLMDYPFTPLRAHAAYWAARVEFEMGRPVEACGHLAQAEEAAGAEIELLNQVRYYLQRCTDLVAPPEADTSGLADTVAAAADTTAPEQGPVFFSVQIAAVSSVARADELMQLLHREGYDSRVFRDPEDGLLKIRVGRYVDRRQAERLAAELKEKLGGQPFVVEER